MAGSTTCGNLEDFVLSFPAPSIQTQPFTTQQNSMSFPIETAAAAVSLPPLLMLAAFFLQPASLCPNLPQ